MAQVCDSPQPQNRGELALGRLVPWGDLDGASCPSPLDSSRLSGVCSPTSPAPARTPQGLPDRSDATQNI